MRLTNILRFKETRPKPLLVRIDVATRASSALCHTRSNLRLSTPVAGENQVDSNGGNVVSFTLERFENIQGLRLPKQAMQVRAASIAQEVMRFYRTQAFFER
jgi:hypothetical protein